MNFMRRLLVLICFTLLSNFAHSQQAGNFKYVINVCSGDSMRVGIPPQIGALHIWPEIAPFYEFYGDTVGAYFENPGETAIVIENFITRFYEDGFVTSDTLIVNILPELQEVLPELNFSICSGDTINVYYPPVPYGFMYANPDSSSETITNIGSPRIDLFPTVSTVYDLFIANVAGCQLGPYDLTVNVQSSLDSLSFTLPDSICFNSEPFEIIYYPNDATVFGTGVSSDLVFLPDLAGPGKHYLTITKGFGACQVTRIDSIYLVSEDEVIFPELPNPCQNDAKFELNGGFPAGGAYLGEGIEGNNPALFNPAILSSGNYTISYNYVGDDECRIEKTQTIFVKAIPEKPELLFNGDSTACAGDTLILNSSIFASRYEWSSGDTTQFIQAFNTGLYYVTIVAANGCRNYSDTTLLSFNPQPELTLVSPTFPNGFNLSAYGSTDGSIDAIITGGVEPFIFTWSNGETTEDLQNIQSGFYQLTISDLGGCGDSDTITLTRPDTIIVVDPPDPEDFDLLIPNAFTPNSDGFNDVFFIRGLIPEHVENEFYVFDFRRQLVYSAQNYSNTWNGTDNNGKRLLTGTYYGIFKSKGLEKPVTTVIDLRYE
jgi:gliding motility-associated-like protein